ncbi:MAG: hypothetical protein HYY24_07865 [Verrucomicrobia bacterium]|nr:hypothetical protein [Verrucomicrobiota bacterium]
MIEILLRTKLEPLAKAQRRCQLLTALTWCWAGAAGAGVALWLFGHLIPGLSRIALPALLVGAGVAAWSMWRRTKTRAPDFRQLAREIEQEQPELHAALLAAVEQQPDHATGLLGYLQHRVIEEALGHRKVHLWGLTIAQRLHFAQWAHVVALALFVGSLLALRTAPSVKQAGRAPLRLFASGVTVTPGDTELEKGNGLVVAARFGGKVPATAELVIQPRTGSLQRVPLTKNLNDPVFGGGLPEVKEDLTYRIEYGEERTRDYTVKVFEHPNLVRADAALTFPEYTGLPQKTIEDTRRVSAVEGTQVGFSFQLNKPVKSAKLIGKDQPEVVLAADTNRPTVYLANFTLDESRHYELRLVDADGRTNRVPPQLQLDALPNRRPELKLAFPRGDQRVSALEEMAFQAEVWDDFGVRAYGLAYGMAGQEPKFVELGQGVAAKEKRPFAHVLALEDLTAEPDQLLTYFLWADDIGPDGQPRRTTGDMFFAEVRPFDEIFREDQDGASAAEAAGEQGASSPTEKLAELQKQIINATWNIQRREAGVKPSGQFKKDIGVVQESQEQALEQAEELKPRTEDPRTQALVEMVQKEMKKAVDQLSDATKKNSTGPLPPALSAEQSAYQALLKLQAREYRVSQNRNRGGGGGAGRAQRQIDQLDLKQSEDRYETQRQAAQQRNPEQREQLKSLNRLKELAQRQQDLNERLKELQTALQEARSAEEREEIRRRLKRLREEEQEILADLDEMRQRMARAETPQTSQSLQQLDQTRAEVRQATEALENDAVSQALAAGTRAQRELQELREDFRKQTASQFSDEMRQMRGEARELAQREEEIGKKLDAAAESQRKSLRDEEGKENVAEQMNRQISGLTNLYSSMRQVIEQSETAEPLLSKQLYDALRKADQGKMENSLAAASQLVQRGFTEEAGKFEERARRGIDDLKRGVERAAESVLGDETEALRLARSELDALTQQLENELTRAQGRDAGEQTGQQAQRAGDTNQVGQASSRSRAQEGSQAQAQASANQEGNSQQQAGASQQQPNSSAQGQRGQPGEQQASGSRAGQQQASAQSQPGQAGGQQTESGNAGQPQASGQSGQPESGRGAQTPRDGQGQQRASGARTGGRNFFDQEGGGGTGPTEGPLTGRDFGPWSDRLGDVAEMLDLPEWRNEVAQARDRARAMRAEYTRHSKEPQWPLVRAQILTPLVEVRNRVAEELARRQSSDSLVPIDRDPVPPKYAERVRRYYEQLGKSE